VRRFGALIAILFSALATQAVAQTTLPMDKGLPVQVKVAIGYVALTGFDENAATFKGTVDVRLRWEDLRLRRPAQEATNPPRVFRGDEAAHEVKKIWVPDGAIANLVGDPGYSEVGLRLYPDGRVELLKRITGEFATEYDVSRFPFGSQRRMPRRPPRWRWCGGRVR
jgi:hypothetical protein